MNQLEMVQFVLRNPDYDFPSVNEWVQLSILKVLSIPQRLKSLKELLIFYREDFPWISLIGTEA